MFHSLKKKIIILGAGGHAKVLADELLSQEIPVFGIISPNEKKGSEWFGGLKVLGDDSCVSRFLPEDILLVNGVGSIGVSAKRRDIYLNFKRAGFQFASVIHSSAVVSARTVLGEGVQVMAGAIVLAGSRLGDNVIVNTKASIDHDCDIAAHVHLAPGVTLSGGVKVGESSHLGTACSVIQNICIGESVTIAAGSVVTQNVSDGAMVMGVPGRRKVVPVVES